MKSRIINPTPETIIVYNQPEKELMGIKRIADKLNLKLLEVNTDQAGEQLGYLAGFSGFSSNNSSESTEIGCMIFSGVSSKKLDKILAELKAAGLSIPYKAVVTAANQSWSLKSLAEELVKEREKLGG